LLALNIVVAVFVIVRQPRGEQAIPKGVSDLEVPEYRPRWWDVKKGREQTASVTVESGEASVQAIDDAGARQSYMISAATESSLTFRTLYFPGWVARADGNPLEVRPGELGYIELTVGPGVNSLTLMFEDTWPRTAGKIVSALSLLLAIALFYSTSVFKMRVASSTT